MDGYGLLRLPFIFFIVLQATRWKIVQGVDYKVTVYIASGTSAGIKAELFGQLTGTEATTSPSKSFGTNWTAGSNRETIITWPTSIGHIQTIAITKSQTGTTNDEGIKMIKVTVESTAMTGLVTFQCHAPYCNIRWPNLIVRLHTAVDGGWSQWTVDCSCLKGTNDAIRARTCSNPAKYFGGKDCSPIGATTEVIKNGCRTSVCVPPTTTKPITTTTTTSKITTDDDKRTTTPDITTTSALIKYGVPILATLVIIAIIVTIVMCVYSLCFAKKEKDDKPKKQNQVVPHDGDIERGEKPMSGRPKVVKPIKHKLEGSGAPKQYTLPVFGANAEKRELFGDDSGDSQTSLLRDDKDKASTGTSTPLAASLPSVQGQEENLYSEVAAPKDEVSPSVGGLPTIVGTTKWSSVQTSAPGSPQKIIHREVVPHTISLPGNTIIRAGSVIESEDISEVT